MSKTPQQIADEALSNTKDIKSAYLYVESFFEHYTEEKRCDAQYLILNSEQAHAEHEREEEMERQQNLNSWDDCYPDPWAGDYQAIINGEL